MTRYKYRAEEKEKHQDRPIVREKRRGREVTRARAKGEETSKGQEAEGEGWERGRVSGWALFIDSNEKVAVGA